jgi:membrane protease YdiL (CAAX protease family)
MKVTLPGALYLSTLADVNKKVFLWGLVCGLFPPILVYFLIRAVMRPAVTGEIPRGGKYLIWVLALVFWGGIFDIPFISIDSFSKSIHEPGLCKLFLATDLLISLLTLGIIFLAFRKKRIPSAYIPFKKFAFDPVLIVFLFFALTPLIFLFFPEILTQNLERFEDPMLISIVSCSKNGLMSGVVLGVFIGALITPFLEEIIFRGLFLKRPLELDQELKTRIALDFAVCLLFAILHYPVNFLFPFLISVATIFLRRRSGSLFPPILIHGVWNLSVIISILYAAHSFTLG